MRLIINIDDETYADIKKGIIYSSIRDVPQESVVAIANGTPLPEGHGRLIDADAMFEDVINYCIDPDAHDWTIFDFINNADTIIEADRKGEGEDEIGD